MAYEWGPRHFESYAAKEDLREKQFHIVKQNPDRTISLASGGDTAHGVLDNAPGIDETAAVCTGGTTKLKLGGTVAVGDRLAPNAEGLAVKAVEGDYAIGTAREAGTDGSIIAARVDLSGAGTVGATASAG